jgi:hypothetical protein
MDEHTITEIVKRVLEESKGKKEEPAPAPETRKRERHPLHRELEKLRRHRKKWEKVSNENAEKRDNALSEIDSRIRAIYIELERIKEVKRVARLEIYKDRLTQFQNKILEGDYDEKEFQKIFVSKTPVVCKFD